MLEHAGVGRRHHRPAQHQPRHPPGQSKASQIARLAESPQWHGGWYHEHGGMAETLLALRLQILQNYGLETLYAQRYPAPRAASRRHGSAWAAEHFDVGSRVEAIRARTLLVQCTTDRVFPANAASRQTLARISAPTRYVELDSPYGHMASGVDIAKWQDQIAWLLDSDTTALKSLKGTP